MTKEAQKQILELQQEISSLEEAKTKLKKIKKQDLTHEQKKELQNIFMEINVKTKNIEEIIETEKQNKPEPQEKEDKQSQKPEEGKPEGEKPEWVKRLGQNDLAKVPIEDIVKEQDVLPLWGIEVCVVRVKTTKLLISYLENVNDGERQGTKEIRKFISKDEVREALFDNLESKIEDISAKQLKKELQKIKGE